MVTVGEVVSGVVTETLLKMEVLRLPLLWLVTARPTLHCAVHRDRCGVPI